MNDPYTGKPMRQLEIFYQESTKTHEAKEEPKRSSNPKDDFLDKPVPNERCRE